MADYLAPFHMPKYSDEGFREKKEAHIRKHGYSITLPKFRDIIHIGLHKPMTKEEKVLWYGRKRDEIPKHRQIELEYQKLRSRERYQKMLASPIPNWQANIISFLTSWDDAQDAIISLAAIGRIATKWLPKILLRWLAWPIGLLWFLSTIMALLIGPTACGLNPLQCKRYMRLKLAYRANTLKGHARPWRGKIKGLAKYEKARLGAGFRGYASSGGYLPSFSEGIQMLQVTDQIFGVGVSIGPLMGMAYDLMSGGVRWIKGEKVVFKNSPSDIEIYTKAADKVHNYARWRRPKTKMTPIQFEIWKDKKIQEGTWGIRSKQDETVLRAMRISSTVYGFKRRTDFQEEAAFYALAEMSLQGMKNVLDYWDPVINVEGIEHIEIEAYHEPNPLIEELLREEGIDPDKAVGWPGTNKRWATYEEIQTIIAPAAADNIRTFTDQCEDEKLRAIGEMSATACGLQAISFMVGEQNLDIQYHAAISIAETLLDKRYSFPLTITRKQMDSFAVWTQAHEDNNTRPTLREILAYAKNSLGFEFVTKA
jgi:hypothetical protein